MRLVALLSARAPAAGPPVGALAPEAPLIGVHMPIEHQARQAILAGAELLIFRTEFPGSDFTRTVDRLTRETGVPALLVADGPDLARRIEKDDHILMLGGQMILPQSAMDELAAATAPSLLVTPTEPATAHFERIDGSHVWAGGALVSGDTVLATVDMLGEWDLELTLLRRAVQQGAQRIVLPSAMAASDQLVRIEEQADAERALAALSQGGIGNEGKQDALGLALAPVARQLVTTLTRLQVNPDQLGWGAGIVSIIGIAAATADWPRVALLIALLAEATLGLHRGCAQLLLRRPAPLWLQVLVKGASIAVLGVIGGRLAQGNVLALSGVGLPLALVAVEAIADTRDREAAPPRAGLWTRLSTGSTLVIALAGAIVGRAAEAYLVIGLCAFGTIAARLLAPVGKRT